MGRQEGKAGGALWGSPSSSYRPICGNTREGSARLYNNKYHPVGTRKEGEESSSSCRSQAGGMGQVSQPPPPPPKGPLQAVMGKAPWVVVCGAGRVMVPPSSSQPPVPLSLQARGRKTHHLSSGGEKQPIRGRQGTKAGKQNLLYVGNNARCPKPPRWQAERS